jgi:ribose/xylose/arabinose/galactoside ABC-type transport system permease subunit
MAAATRPVPRVRRPRASREAVLLGVLVVVVVVLAQFSELFLTLDNFLNTSRFFVEAGLIALGLTLVIIAGGIDLSVGAALALVSVAIGFTFQAGVPLPLAIVLGLAIGAAAGAFNGVLITALDLNPLAVTLGTFAFFRGIAYAISDANAVSEFPAWFAYFGQYYFMGIPGQLLAFLAAAVAIGLLLSRTRFGRYVYAIGANEEAARFTGVPVGKVKIALFCLVGLLVAVAAIIYTSRVSTARANAGLGLELDVIAAVVLGGASIYGGVGTITGTVLGVLIIAVLRNGLTLAGVDTTWQLVLLGVVLIVGVFVNEVFRRRDE